RLRASESFTYQASIWFMCSAANGWHPLNSPPRHGCCSHPLVFSGGEMMMIKLPCLAALSIVAATAQPAAADPLLHGGAAAKNQINIPFGSGEVGLTPPTGLLGLSAKKDPLTGVPILDAGLSDWRNTP